MAIEIVNLTPHPFTLYHNGQPVMELPKAAQPARVAVERDLVKQFSIRRLGGGYQTVSVYASTFGDIQHLPEPEDGVVYVASRIVATAASEQGRTDVLCPDETVRDPEGRIVGCRSLARV